jgi:hypothetical protein
VGDLRRLDTLERPLLLCCSLVSATSILSGWLPVRLRPTLFVSADTKRVGLSLTLPPSMRCLPTSRKRVHYKCHKSCRLSNTQIKKREPKEISLSFPVGPFQYRCWNHERGCRSVAEGSAQTVRPGSAAADSISISLF